MQGCGKYDSKMTSEDKNDGSSFKVQKTLPQINVVNKFPQLLLV